MLENEGTLQDYKVYAFIYLSDEQTGMTVKEITMFVRARSKPEAFDKPEDAELFHEVIRVVNDAADRANESEKRIAVDRQAVEVVRQEVEQLGNRITETAKQGVQAINAAKQNAVEDVTQTGTAQKTIVENAGSKAVEAINSAKNEAIQTVQSEGTTQTGNVTAEGAKQIKEVQDKGAEVLQSIQEDFQTQMERKLDKQQGIENAGKALVIGKDGLVVPIKPQEDGANAIVNVATDELIVVNDSAERKIQGLRMMGKTEQASTTGAQLLNLKDGTYTVVGVTVEIINGTVKLSGTATSNGGRTIKLSEPFLLKLGTYISETDIPADCILSKVSDNSYMASANQSFIVKEDTEVYFGINFASQKSYNGAYHVMLNSGNVSLPYEPYTGGKPSPSPEYPQKLVNAGKLNKDTGKYEVDVKLTGKNLFDREAFLKSELIGNYVFCEIDLSPNTTYTFSDNYGKWNGSKIHLSLSTNKTMDGRIFILINTDSANRNNISFKTNESKTYYLYAHKNSAQTILNNASEIQIENGEKATPYEPYRSPQSLTIRTPNGLPGIPVKSGGNYTDSTGQQWICDEIDLGRGKYVERIWTKVFDGSEEWGIYGTLGVEGFSSYDALPSPSERRAGLCNLYEVKTVNDEKEGIWLGVRNSKIYACKSRFYDDSLTDKGLANWKAFLAAHPMTVMTYVDTPTERDLSPEEIEAYKALHTYYPTTIIQNSEGVNMTVQYIADTKNYIDTKIAEMRTALANTNAQLLNK